VLKHILITGQFKPLVTYKSPRMAKQVLIETSGDLEELLQIIESRQDTLSLTIDVKRNNQDNPSNMIPFRMCKQVIELPKQPLVQDAPAPIQVMNNEPAPSALPQP